MVSLKLDLALKFFLGLFLALDALPGAPPSELRLPLALFYRPVSTVSILILQF
jgi:hypothetical protein